jgi:hypothetical protein
MIPSYVHAVWWGDEGLVKQEEEGRVDSEAEYLQLLHMLCKINPIWLYEYATYTFQMYWPFPMLL